MATIKSFKAIRPTQELVNKVACLPYDVMSTQEAKEIAKDNPYSFLHIDKSEIDLDESIDIYDKKVYEKARDNLNNMIKNKVLIQDDKPYVYVYKLTMNGINQTGLVVCTSVDEYLDGTIKKHELTQEKKQLDRTNHVDYCNANTGPIFLTYKEENSIKIAIEKWISLHSPVYSFKSEDSTSQEVWIITDNNIVNKLIEDFKHVKSLYIADGHHRCASAVEVALKRRKENPNYTGDEEFNYFLSVIFPHDQLRIMEYNRVVKDLNSLTKQEFLDKLKIVFNLNCSKDNKPYMPNKIHKFGMYIGKQWYELSLKDEFVNDGDEIERLDVSILQNKVLEPILNISNPRIDSRIDFVGGIRGLNELVKSVDSGEMTVAFSMYPTSINDLMDIADAGKIMPPKSTWFEPKLRSGLFIHSLS